MASTVSLGRRLLSAFLVVSLLPLLLSTLVTYWRATDVVMELMAENVGKTARVYADEVDAFLADHRRLLTMVGAGLSADADTLVLDQVVGGSPALRGIVLLDAEGNVSAASSETPEWALRTCLEGAQTPSHSHEGQHEVVVRVPWEHGSLCGRVSFTLHQDMLTARAQSSFGGVAYIVDRSGEVVCHSFEDDEAHAHPGEMLGEPVVRAAEAGSMWFGRVEYDGRDILAAYAPARSLPWGVWAEVPVSAATDSLRPVLARNVVLALALMGGIVVVVVFLSRRLARPVEELAERTEQLKQARQFSDTLLDTLEERVLVIDDQLEVVRANRSAIEAYGEHVVGCPCHSVHGNAGCPARQVLDTGLPLSEERVLPGSSPRILAVDLYPIRSEGAVLEIARDVTDLKQFQAQLLHQEKMAALGTLAAGMAHEIGNPLASLSSELEMLERFWEPDQARASLPVLRGQIGRISGLLRELVDFGRQERDEVSLFAPQDLVADVVRLLAHDPRARGTTIEGLGATEVAVRGNRDRLLQVLLNLGLNAVSAVEGSGRVVLDAVVEEDWLVLTVDDDGPGVAEQDRERIFEPFVTTRPPGEGTGLGLFVSRRILDGLGGRLEVRESPLGGARFLVSVPQAEQGDG